MQAYTLAEVMSLGIEARHTTEDGVIYLWSGGFAVRTDPQSGVSVLITNCKHLPEEPWHRLDEAGGPDSHR